MADIKENVTVSQDPAILEVNLEGGKVKSLAIEGKSEKVKEKNDKGEEIEKSISKSAHYVRGEDGLYSQMTVINYPNGDGEDKQIKSKDKITSEQLQAIFKKDAAEILASGGELRRTGSGRNKEELDQSTVDFPQLKKDLDADLEYTVSVDKMTKGLQKTKEEPGSNKEVPAKVIQRG